MIEAILDIKIEMEYIKFCVPEENKHTKIMQVLNLITKGL